MPSPQTPLTRPVQPRDPAAATYRWAWLSLLLYPLTFVAAFVVGEGLLSLVAEDAEDPAVWEVVVSATPALLVFVAPGVLAVLLGRRALASGDPRGKAPAVVGAAIAVAFVGLNLLSYALVVLFD